MSQPLSLNKTIQGNVVHTERAERAFSQRFLNRNAIVCPSSSNKTNAGRPVSCPITLGIETAGCNTALQRVYTENQLSR